MPYFLLIVAAIVAMCGVTKISRATVAGRPGALLVWGVLLGAGVDGLMSAPIH